MQRRIYGGEVQGLEDNGTLAAVIYYYGFAHICFSRKCLCIVLVSLKDKAFCFLFMWGVCVHTCSRARTPGKDQGLLSSFCSGITPGLARGIKPGLAVSKANALPSGHSLTSSYICILEATET